jgi:probable F420-dependent oxidoreductase
LNPRPFRFGVQYTGNTLAEWQGMARKLEDLGFSTLVTQDHYGAQLAPMPSLVSAAAVTSRIRLGPLVLDNDFRHPAAMVKEAATVDVLTGGRLELGLGAGWLMPDYTKTGIVFASPGERFERLREAVAITKLFFSEPEKMSFQGKYYQIDGLDTQPKAVQTPHPPLLIGGRQKRMLALAAREADIVSISMLDRLVRTAGDETPLPTFAEKVGWVRDAAGARFDEIEIHVMAANAEVTDDAKGAIESIAERLKQTPEEVLNTPATLIGSVDEIAERLMMWREHCQVSYFVVPARVVDDWAAVIAKVDGK